MDTSNRRKGTRTQAWQDISATIKIFDTCISDSRRSYLIKGSVDNIGSTGMFLKTDDFIPVPAKANITIHFDPYSDSKDYSLKISGETVRVTMDGVGIKFTAIDLSELQKCIIHRMNSHITVEA